MHIFLNLFMNISCFGPIMIVTDCGGSVNYKFYKVIAFL